MQKLFRSVVLLGGLLLTASPAPAASAPPVGLLAAVWLPLLGSAGRLRAVDSLLVARGWAAGATGTVPAGPWVFQQLAPQAARRDLWKCAASGMAAVPPPVWRGMGNERGQQTPLPGYVRLVEVFRKEPTGTEISGSGAGGAPRTNLIFWTYVSVWPPPFPASHWRT